MAVALPQSETEISIMDLAPYLADQAGALESTAAALGSALEQWGCVLLLQHGVDQALIAETFAAAAAFHAQPAAAKQALPVMQSGFASGYIHHDTPTLCIAGFYFTSSPSTVCPDRHLHATVETYARAVTVLSRRLLPVLAQALGLPFHSLAHHLDDAFLHCQVLHYPGADSRGAPPEARPDHADPSFWTFLPASDVPGLYIQQHHSGAWGPVPVVPDSVLLMVGEAMTAYSQGRYAAPVHRVVVPGQDRYAIPVFIAPALR